MKKKPLSVIKTKLKLFDLHTIDIAKKSSASIFVKLIGMGVNILISITLGRILGAEGLGVINLSTQISTIIITVGLFGMQPVIIKYIAIAKSKGEQSEIGNIMYSAFLINGIGTLMLSIIFISLTPYLARNFFEKPDLIIPLMILLMVVTPQVLSRVFSSALIGFHKIWQSNLVDQTLSISVTGLMLLVLKGLDIEITINVVAFLYAVGKLSVTITMILYWKKLYKFKYEKNFIGNKLTKMAIPLYLVTLSTVSLTNVGTIFLGWLGSSSDVAIFTVASRVALLTSFIMQITNSAMAPKLAALFESNRLNEMEKLVQQITVGLGLIGLIPLLIFFFEGKFILGLWGNEFQNGYWILLIVSTGQYFNIATGAAGTMLNMCGFESEQRNISLIFAFLNLLLNYVFILLYGVFGAAIATAATTIGQNITRLLIAKNRIGISTISFIK